MKILVVIMVSVFSIGSQAGFYEKSYFEPVVACGVGAAVGSGFTNGNHDEKSKNAITYCAGAALLMGVLNYHYFNKYYTEEFDRSFQIYAEKEKRYKKAIKMIKSGKSLPKRFKKNFKVSSEVVEPSVDENGNAVEKKVIQKIILKNIGREIGR